MNTIDLLTESGHQIMVESGNNHLIVWRRVPVAGGGGSKFARGAKPPAPTMSPYAQRGFGNAGYRKVRIKNLVTVKVTFDDDETSFAVDMNTRDFRPKATVSSLGMGNIPTITLIYPQTKVYVLEQEEVDSAPNTSMWY